MSVLNPTESITQRVSFPPADRVAHHEGSGLCRARGAGRINLPAQVVELEEFDYHGLASERSRRKGVHVDSRHTGWEGIQFHAF